MHSAARLLLCSTVAVTITAMASAPNCNGHSAAVRIALAMVYGVLNLTLANTWHATVLHAAGWQGQIQWSY
jgi:hypothetical protein